MTGCSVEYLPGAMDDKGERERERDREREREREREKEQRAINMR